MKVVVGVGGSGSQAAPRVKSAMTQLARFSVGRILGTSDVYENPAVGGVTLAPFANAAVLMDWPESLEKLWQKLHQLERREGRVRVLKNGARTVDLDILWAEQQVTQGRLRVPHPRFLERDFALLPAMEAWRAAGLTLPLDWAQAARKLTAKSRMRRS